MTSSTSIRVLASLLLLAACDPDAAPPGKGVEDNPLTGGKADSFFHPTMHGTLGFELTHRASFSDQGTFHAWTFALDADATFTLRTEVEGNLDTVLFLYHRDDPEDSWGPFVEKNDDFEEQLFSQITFDGGPGQYRVLVKPFKDAMRGDFSVVGSCEGEGCPQSGTPSCDPDEVLPMPATSGLTEACAARFIEVLASEVEFTSGTEIEHTMKCDLDGLMLDGVQLYESFWTDLVGSLEDALGFDPDEGVRLDIMARAHDHGDTVGIDAGGDEDAMSIVYADGERLMLFQHNQSPTVEWFCDDSSPALPAPDEDCISAALFGLPHGDEVGGLEGTASVDDASESGDARVAAAIARFAATHGLDQTTEVDFDAQVWESLDFDNGAVVTVMHQSGGAIYHVVHHGFGGGTIVISEQDEDGFALICEE